MKAIHTILVLTLTALLATPASIAGWSVHGDSEPSTAQDSATLMWQDPPVAELNRVYFSGFVMHSAGIVSLGVNPNVAVLETRNEPFGVETYGAILGNWIDCNGDGYIGLAETAMREYDAVLLLDTSICPPSSGEINAWDGKHNYNGWVTELVPIGTDGGQPSASPNGVPDVDDNDQDLRIYRDNESRVWGDYGRPDQGVAGAVATCPIRPFPRGTLATTGGILDYTDCHSQRGNTPGLLERWNDAMEAAGLTDQKFTDANDGRSAPIGQIDTLGTEDSERAPLVLTDCTAEPIFDSSATFNGTNAATGGAIGPEDQAFIDENTRTKLYPLAPATRDTTAPTIPGQINQTSEEFGGDCDTTNDAGHDTYGLLEADFEGSSATDKRQAQFNMEFEDNGVLGTFPRGGIADPFFGLPTAAWPDALHPGGSGMTLNNQVGSHDWFARVALVKANAPGVRADVANSDVGIADARWITFYAYVGATSTTTHGLRTPGGLGTYGAAQCGSFTSGVHNGWNCDPALWYVNAIGTPQPEVQGGMARPGASYNLIDVDCIDGNNNVGVPTGFAALGANPCS